MVIFFTEAEHYYFGPWVYPRGPSVITLVCQSVVCLSVVHPSVLPRSVFEYLRDHSLVFSNFLHEVRAPLGYKIDRAPFLNKIILWGHKWGKTFGGICQVLFPYFFIQSLTSTEFSCTLKAQHYLTPPEKCKSIKIWFWLYIRDQTPILRLVFSYNVNSDAVI